MDLGYITTDGKRGYVFDEKTVEKIFEIDDVQVLQPPVYVICDKTSRIATCEYFTDIEKADDFCKRLNGMRTSRGEEPRYYFMELTDSRWTR